MKSFSFPCSVLVACHLLLEEIKRLDQISWFKTKAAYGQLMCVVFCCCWLKKDFLFVQSTEIVT